MGSLEGILFWELNEEETRIYKLCLAWEKVLDRELPRYYSNRLPAKSDPRKSLIYRYCRKLLIETNGLIPDSEYGIYILAQVQTLKSLCDSNGVHALVEPACLCGYSAWRRWQMWKRDFEKEKNRVTARGSTDDIFANIVEVTAALQKTKKFFISQFGENYQKQDIEKAIASKEIVKWITFNKVCDYYLVLSPLIKKYFKEIDDTFSVDSEVLSRSISPPARALFEQDFAVEF